MHPSPASPRHWPVNWSPWRRGWAWADSVSPAAVICPASCARRPSGSADARVDIHLGCCRCRSPARCGSGRPIRPARLKVSAVAEIAPLRVQLIAKTDFLAPPDVPWGTDADGGPALVEFAGRACYQSWSKPNPKTATNAGYIKHIIDVGHFSVLEHASVSFYITGISRSCTHELIRHRHFSYSQLSQRYVPEKESHVVVPPGMEDDPVLQQILTAAADASRATY